MMTEDRAIEIMNWYSEAEYGIGSSIAEAHMLAAKALKEIQQLRAIGTIEEFKALKEKTKPKKLLDDGMRIPFSYYCPNCKAELSDDGYKYDDDYCPNCGQAIEQE